MKKPTDFDLDLHTTSLLIASIYRRAYAAGSTNIAILDDILTAYRSLRRHIGTTDEGPRFGATAAHRAMNGDID